MKIKKSILYQACASALTVGAAAIMLLPTATHAATNTIVVWGDNFNSATNPYGGVAWQFQNPPVGNPQVIITNDLPEAPSTRNCAFIFQGTNVILNFGWETSFLPATNNTHTSLSDYSLEFDMAVQGVSFTALGGYIAPTFALFGPGSGLYYGQGLMTNPPLSIFPAAGTGYQHISMPLINFVAAHAALLNPTNSPLAFSIGFYMSGPSYTGLEEIDIANLQLTMNTNPPPPPQPKMTVLPAKPGLRIFAQDSTFTYNQEGFGTVDSGQTWLYGDSFFAPVSYSITFADFDTVNNYTFYAQFVPNSGNSGNPYIVYFSTNALTWSITHQNTGFTTSVDWKTNAPNAGNISNALAMITTSTNGRGTWTITFTSDTQGSVTGPDGTNKSFSLPPEVSALFASSGAMTILFGTAPNNTAGYGQYIDIKSILITNVPGINESDDFTKDSALNTAWWNPGFSYNPGSVILVSTNSAYWVNWTVPDLGFGLETKASLNSGTNVWFSPSYYGSSVGAANTVPTLMGYSLKWTLIPKACLPTVDGTTNGPVSRTAFFRLSNPPPAQ